MDTYKTRVAISKILDRIINEKLSPEELASLTQSVKDLQESINTESKIQGRRGFDFSDYER